MLSGAALSPRPPESPTNPRSPANRGDQHRTPGGAQQIVRNRTEHQATYARPWAPKTAWATVDDVAQSVGSALGVAPLGLPAPSPRASAQPMPTPCCAWPRPWTGCQRTCSQMPSCRSARTKPGPPISHRGPGARRHRNRRDCGSTTTRAQLSSFLNSRRARMPPAPSASRTEPDKSVRAGARGSGACPSAKRRPAHLHWCRVLRCPTDSRVVLANTKSTRRVSFDDPLEPSGAGDA
jgi:hypothetical protein